MLFFCIKFAGGNKKTLYERNEKKILYLKWATTVFTAPFKLMNNNMNMVGMNLKKMVQVDYKENYLLSNFAKKKNLLKE